MLVLAKIAAIAVLVWFYTTAQQYKQPPVKWAVIGFIGYVIAWFLVYESILSFLPPALSRTTVMGFIVVQIPAFCALAATYFVRQKMIHDVVKNNDDTV